ADARRAPLGRAHHRHRLGQRLVHQPRLRARWPPPAASGRIGSLRRARPRRQNLAMPTLSALRLFPLLLALAAAPAAAHAGARAPATGAPPATPAAVQAEPAVARLHAVFEADAAWRREEYGHWQPGPRLPSVTPAAWERRIAHWRGLLEALDGIDAASLPREDQVNLAVFRSTTEA